MRAPNTTAHTSKKWLTAVVAMATVLIAMATGDTANATTGQDEVVELARTTTITGDGPGYVDVMLPVNTTFDTPFGSSSDVTIDGGGVFTGFALIGSEDATRGASLVGGRIAGADPINFLMPVGDYPSPGGGAYFEGVKTYDDNVHHRQRPLPALPADR